MPVETTHPYAVRGQSPRQIMEYLLCAFSEAQAELRDEDDRALARVKAVNAALEAMTETGVGFCDINDRTR